MADAVGGRHFVAIATSTYDDPVWPPLSGIVEEVTALREWLCADQLGDRRFSPAYSELADNPTKAQLRAALEDPSPERTWTRADAAVVFVTGHGQIAHDTHYVILKKSDSARLRSTAIRSSDLIG